VDIDVLLGSVLVEDVSFLLDFVVVGDVNEESWRLRAVCTRDEVLRMPPVS